MVIDEIVLYNCLFRIVGRKILHIQYNTTEIRFFIKDISQKRFLDLLDLRMPNLKLYSNTVIHRKLTQKDDTHLILTFFIFSFKIKTISVELKTGRFHMTGRHLINISLYVMQP